MTMTPKLRAKLNALVESSKKSKLQIAEEAEVSRSDFTKLLSGEKSDIETGTLERLAKALGCRVELLQVKK